MKIFISVFFLISATNSFSQYNSIQIPEFKNLDSNDKYPKYSVLTSYLDRFDLLISLNSFSAWGPDESIKVLAHHQSGWYKIEINTDHKNFGTFDAVCYLMFQLNDSIGDNVWKILVKNHLFDMADERLKNLQCSDTIRKNGKNEIIQFLTVSDGPEYEFGILTKTNYKKLYFYSPQYIDERCPGANERRWIINCINVFEKYLGN